MLNTGASCSIINYWAFWEISQIQHPITVHRSNKLTKTTHRGQVVPMIGYATIEFSYDPNGEYSFPLTSGLRKKILKTSSGWTFVRTKFPEVIWIYLVSSCGRLQKLFVIEVFTKTKFVPDVFRILTVRLPCTVRVDAKSTRCWKYSPGDPKSLLPLGSTFQPNRGAMSTGLNFVKITCTHLEPTLPILIENNKNHQVTLLKGLEFCLWM